MKQGRFRDIVVYGIYRQKSPYFVVFLGYVHASSCNGRYVARFIGTRDSRFTVVTKCSSTDGRNANVRNARRRSNDVRRASIWWNTAKTRSMAGHLLEKRGLSRARQTVAAVCSTCFTVEESRFRGTLICREQLCIRLLDISSDRTRSLQRSNHSDFKFQFLQARSFPSLVEANYQFDVKCEGI